MIRLKLNRQQLSRTLLTIVVTFTAALLSGCGGGIFGTSSSSDSVAVTDAVDSSGTAATGGDIVPDTDSGTPAATPEPVAPEAPGNNESDSPSRSINFSNTTPSGIDPSSPAVPALKLINLTEATLSVNALEQSTSAPPQATSDLLRVNAGQSLVDVRIQDTETTLTSIAPLNAGADTITTLVIEANTSTFVSEAVVVVLALDTRAVASTNAMADVRVVYTQAANPSSASPDFILSPVENSTGGAELVLINATRNNPEIGVYELANAGDYLLSPSDSSFTPQPITLRADTVYTIVITGNSETPVYIEVDSFSDSD
ncbi:MAG: hypothetical protein AB8B64_09755 [Granulosicoccus sp.]